MSLPAHIPAGRSREVLVAGRRVPLTANETRSRHMRLLAGSRTYIWRFVIGGGVAFVGGAAIGGLTLALIAPAVAIGIVLFLMWRDASKLAQRDFYTGFALGHGFSYSGRMTLMEITPLLGAGDRRHCEHYMEGPLDKDGSLTAGLAHYTYETREQRNSRRDRVVNVYTPHHYTICVVEIARAMNAFPGVFLARRGGMLGRDEWLDRPSLQPIELESADLANRYELLARTSQDRTRLMELFQPSFQTWLANLPQQLFFEYSGGTLVVYATKKLGEGSDLELMLQVTENIAKRILREGEPLQVVSSSVAPPKGDQAFPPPPPATKPALAPSITAVPDPLPAQHYQRASVPPPGA